MAVKTSWAAGDVLTAADLTDTFAAKAANADLGLNYLTKATASAAASVSVDNVFTSSATAYRIVFIGKMSTSGSLYFRVRVSGSDISTTTYNRNVLYGTGSAAGNSAATGQTSLMLGDLNTAESQAITADIFNVYASLPTTVTAAGLYGAATQASLAVGTNTNATSYTGFTLVASTGTLTGTVWCFSYLTT